MRLVGPLGRAATFWQRSIQARVVVSTLVLSAVVVTLVGWILMRQITDGLVTAKTTSSVAEASRGAYDAQSRLEGAPGTEFDTSAQLAQLVAGIVARGEVQGYDVVLDGPVPGTSLGAAPASGGTFKSPDVLTGSIPADLRDVVESTPGTSWTYTRIAYEPGSGRPTVPGVVAGTQVDVPSDGGTYTLYYLFPLTEERETLGVVRGALLSAGALLLVLVGGLTWLVTRQVVTPVRLARRVAERLSSGRLEERMQVRGDDDIARLATSFNQMAANLQRQIRQLEELSRVQRRFVSDVSHELRTPLTTVRMAGDVLYDARERFDPVTARAAELLQKELDRFEALLADLLEISRFDAGAAALDLEDVDLTDLAHRVVDTTATLAQNRGVEVVVHEPSRRCVAEADARRVERIVRNLVSNAIDHAEGRDIDIHLAATDDAAALAVRDHGVGLRGNEAQMVFNRFWRADPARARSTGGTGLGLAISREDARLHGGWLQAWGEPGEGSQFRLTLPRRAGDPLSSSPLALVPADARQAGARADERAGASGGPS